MRADMPRWNDMRTPSRERGQAMIESALIMMVVLPVLIGIVDLGQFLYFHQSLSERVRAGTRYGAVHNFNNGIGNGVEAVNVAIYNDPAGAANGATEVLPYLNKNAGTDGYVFAVLSNPGTEDARISVTIENYPYSFWLLPSPRRTITETEPYEVVP